MSPILFFIIFFTYTGVGKIFLQINSSAVAFVDILIAAWEGLKSCLVHVRDFYSSMHQNSKLTNQNSTPRWSKVSTQQQDQHWNAGATEAQQLLKWKSF